MQAHSYDEVEAFQQLATGLVINVGTLTPDWVASMELAAKTANKLGKPWVLDPVGAGATPFRTQARHVTCSLTDLCCLVLMLSYRYHKFNVTVLKGALACCGVHLCVSDNHRHCIQLRRLHVAAQRQYSMFCSCKAVSTPVHEVPPHCAMCSQTLLVPA